jgi:hypothetical protein
MEVTIHLPMLTNDEFNHLLQKGIIQVKKDESNTFMYYL